jgi:4-diphosphocytidyl-2-C-methyl-D-erythritol kinase
MTLRAIYEVPAPAKLNLFLHVVGRRDDGYHLLESLFVLIDWCDTLHFETRADGALHRRDLGAALPPDDLCLRAARALQMASGTALGADILIDKQLPWGAGLGGGSSDAASTLLALNRLWGLRWPRSRLLALGLTLGADVPFFLGGRNAFVEGIGERLTPVTLARQWFAVLKPAASIDTRAIFGSPLLGGSAACNPDTDILESLSPNEESARKETLPGSTTTLLASGFGRNDLQPAAQAECAEVAQAAAVLHAMFGNSRMTGSGSAVFARAGTADRAQMPMPSGLPAGWVGRMSRSLVEHPLVGWAED